MKKLLIGKFISLALLCVAKNLSAQEYDEAFVVQSIALGNVSSILSSSFNALGNPALIREGEKSSIGIAVTNKFLLTNLKQAGLGVNHRFSKSDGIGLAIQFNGTLNLRQNTIALAYAKKLNEKVNAGISIIYLNTFEQTIGSKNNILGKAGMTYKPSRSIMLGVTVFNPLASKFTALTDERIPSYLAAGILYKLSKQVKIYAEYKLGFKESGKPSLGLSYEPQPGFIIYAGLRNTASPISFGISLKLKNISINIASQYHQLLGFSPAVGMDWKRE